MRCDSKGNTVHWVFETAELPVFDRLERRQDERIFLRVIQLIHDYDAAGVLVKEACQCL